MDLVKMGNLSFTIAHPKPLQILGFVVQAGGAEQMDVPSLKVGYLGLCCRGDGKPSHRTQGESMIVYGNRVYDHLTEAGATYTEIMDASLAAYAEALELLPAGITKEEEEEAADLSDGQE